MMVGGGKFNILRDLFFDIENSPVAYLPSSRVYSYIKKIYGSDFIRRRDVELFERTYVRPTQILKESRSERKKTLAYFVHGPNLLWQADLVDFQHGPYKFILTVIDVFSKKADAEPITSKSGVKVSDAFRKIGERWGEYPVRLQTDKGKEFFNKLYIIMSVPDSNQPSLKVSTDVFNICYIFTYWVGRKCRLKN